MPTGYTEPMYDGKDISFREFVLRCSRGMMPLVSMRDHALDAEIPEKLVPSDYREKQITEWRAALTAAESMTAADAERAATEAHNEEVCRREKSARERAALRDRYASMLANVESWAPPTKDHDGLKRFMIEQLQESMRFDCGEYSWPEPLRLSGAQFRSGRIVEAHKQIARHEAELARERQRCDASNAWLSALRGSLSTTDL